jgi:hypothetical protein
LTAPAQKKVVMGDWGLLQAARTGLGGNFLEIDETGRT